MARISVVSLTLNKLPVTRKCFTSLLESLEPEWELVVVDNGSTDGTREWLHTFAAQASEKGVVVKTVFNDENAGCSTARNQGVAAASGDFITFVDNDIALRSRDWLGNMARFLQEHPEVAMIGPKLVYPFAPYRIQCAGAAVTPRGRIVFRGRGAEKDDPRFNDLTEVQCLISACVMVTREAFETAGGFDEVFNPVEYEDLDLCYRIRSHGFTNLYMPDVEMYHFESVTTAGTTALPNTALIIKHSLAFKKRWSQMFENENGPDETEAQWERIPIPPFDTIGELPLV